MTDITILIPTKNEARNVRDCIESVRWADQVFVIDSNSTDGTAEIAAAAGAQVVQFNYSGGWPKKKNWALQNLPIRTQWTMILDADERVTPELAEELRRVLSSTTLDGFYVRWKFIFLGRWLRHCWNHGWMLRIFRTGRAEYENLGLTNQGGWDNEVHENMILDGRSGRLLCHLQHEDKKDVFHWLAKHNQYSDWEVARRAISAGDVASSRHLLSADPRLRRKAQKAIFLRLPFRPLAMFLYLYVWKRGFLDGRPGLYFCGLMAWHEFVIGVKAYEKCIKGPSG
jgi:glycosyltransferase involved in cell wall biosynthesis